MAKMKRKMKQEVKIESPFKNYWDRGNYIFLSVGLLLVVLGFILMTVEPWENSISLTISPIILLVAYIIIFPLSIIFKRK